MFGEFAVNTRDYLPPPKFASDLSMLVKKNISPRSRNQEIVNYSNERTAFMVNYATSSPYLILILISRYVQANPVQGTFATEFQISRNLKYLLGD